jgi:multiple sugar transport system ATP-binding protein
MTLLPVTVGDTGLATAGRQLPGSADLAAALRADGRSSALLGVRPENITIEPADDAAVPGGLAATATTVERLGAETVIGFKLGHELDLRAVGASATRGLHHARLPGETTIAPGDRCHVRPQLGHAVLFDDETGRRIDLAARP